MIEEEWPTSDKQIDKEIFDRPGGPHFSSHIEIGQRLRQPTFGHRRLSISRARCAPPSLFGLDWKIERTYLNMEARCPTSEIRDLQRDLQKGCCSIKALRLLPAFAAKYLASVAQ